MTRNNFIEDVSPKSVNDFLSDGDHPHPDVSRPETDGPYRQAIIDAREKRESKPRKHTSRAEILAATALATVTLASVAAGVSLGISGGDSAKPQNTPAEKLSAEQQRVKVRELFELKVMHENDVWKYIELFSKTENESLGEVTEMVLSANPDVDFHKIPVGNSVIVPGLSYPAYAGQVGLETDQPLDDVHVD